MPIGGIGGVGGYGGINPYEAYADRFAGSISAEDAVEMADAVDAMDPAGGSDFDEDLSRMQGAVAVQPTESEQMQVLRIEPAEQSSGSGPDGMRRDLSNVMEDMMDIQGSLWGFSVRRVIPLAGGLQ